MGVTSITTKIKSVVKKIVEESKGRNDDTGKALVGLKKNQKAINTKHALKIGKIIEMRRILEDI